MALNSFNFWLIYPFIFGLYWLIPSQYKTFSKVFLVLVSYLLYLNWQPIYALILFAITFISYLSGRVFEDYKNRKGTIIWGFSILCFLPLLIFKYDNFINESIYDFLSYFGLKFKLNGLNWAIPVGISFYTFQAAGYMFDVYRGKTTVEKNYLDYLLFISFFPQVISGPISKASELLPQIKEKKIFDYELGKQGLKWLLWGMFIKLVIADRLGLFVDQVYNNFEHYNGTTCLVASVFYSVQIYCDFAGYSYMAIGIAATLGFNLINNFRQPYFAISVTDFWHRWHISLTRWLTNHIYFPLGGSRCGKFKTYRNIVITFLISGIWHGANWTFIAWGLLHGIVQSVEKLLGLQKYEGHNVVIIIIRIIITFIIVNIAWIYFRMPTIGDANEIIIKIFVNPGKPSIADMGGTASLILVITLPILILKDFKDRFANKSFLFLQKKPIQWAIYLCLFCMILSLGVLDGGQFIYVSF